MKTKTKNALILSNITSIASASFESTSLKAKKAMDNMDYKTANKTYRKARNLLPFSGSGISALDTTVDYLAPKQKKGTHNAKTYRHCAKISAWTAFFRILRGDETTALVSSKNQDNFFGPIEDLRSDLIKHYGSEFMVFNMGQKGLDKIWPNGEFSK